MKVGYKVEKNSLAGDVSRQGAKKKLECAEEENLDPPINTECFHSGGGTTMIFIVTGAKSVLPWVPLAPLPKKLGWSNTSAQWKRSATTAMMFPSGRRLAFPCQFPRSI